MAHDRVLEIWYDGKCPVCRASRDWCAARDPEGRLEFRDFRSATEVELPVSPAAADASMWVRGADGALAAGYAGWRRILAELPGWRWLARISGVPPLRWLGPPVYRLIARARRLLPGYGHDARSGERRPGDAPQNPSFQGVSPEAGADPASCFALRCDNSGNGPGTETPAPGT